MALWPSFCVCTLCPGQATLYPLNSVPYRGDAGPCSPSLGQTQKPVEKKSRAPKHTTVFCV